MAHAYQSIWADANNGNDSPMRVILNQQVDLLQKLLQERAITDVIDMFLV